MKFLFCLKTIEMQRGITLCQDRCFQAENTIFTSFALFQRVDIELAMTCLFWRGNFCDVISLKVE